MSDRIEKRIEIRAPISRVWRALTDYREFGQWFQARLDGPFVPGQLSTGQITYPGYEHLRWEATVQAMEPERLFSFTWPHILDEEKDHSQAPSTLVEFRLEAIPGGTLLVVTESGFDKFPAAVREESYRRNEAGWTEQVKNIERHVAKDL